jgi:hypothetical protein
MVAALSVTLPLFAMANATKPDLVEIALCVKID